MLARHDDKEYRDIPLGSNAASAAKDRFLYGTFRAGH